MYLYSYILHDINLDFDDINYISMEMSFFFYFIYILRCNENLHLRLTRV